MRAIDPHEVSVRWNCEEWTSKRNLEEECGKEMKVGIVNNTDQKPGESLAKV